MKKTIFIAAMSVVLLSAVPALAEKTPPAGKESQSAQQAPDVAKFDKQMAQIQENLKAMQAQMVKIGQIQDPQERQRLLQEHWTTMQNTSGMMGGMWGPGMMGCCGGGMMGGRMMGGHMTGNHMMGDHMMGWRGMEGYYSNLTPEQMKQRQYMMDQYMGTQQMMMDQMMQHQQWMWQPK